jgi:hypothetical protein
MILQCTASDDAPVPGDASRVEDAPRLNDPSGSRTRCTQTTTIIFGGRERRRRRWHPWLFVGAALLSLGALLHAEWAVAVLLVIWALWLLKT